MIGHRLGEKYAGCEWQAPSLAVKRREVSRNVGLSVVRVGIKSDSPTVMGETPNHWTKVEGGVGYSRLSNEPALLSPFVHQVETWRRIVRVPNRAEESGSDPGQARVASGRTNRGSTRTVRSNDAHPASVVRVGDPIAARRPSGGEVRPSRNREPAAVPIRPDRVQETPCYRRPSTLGCLGPSRDDVEQPSSIGRPGDHPDRVVASPRVSSVHSRNIDGFATVQPDDHEADIRRLRKGWILRITLVPGASNCESELPSIWRPDRSAVGEFVGGYGKHLTKVAPVTVHDVNARGGTVHTTPHEHDPPPVRRPDRFTVIPVIALRRSRRDCMSLAPVQVLGLNPGGRGSLHLQRELSGRKSLGCAGSRKSRQQTSEKGKDRDLHQEKVTVPSDSDRSRETVGTRLPSSRG